MAPVFIIFRESTYQISTWRQERYDPAYICCTILIQFVHDRKTGHLASREGGPRPGRRTMRPRYRDVLGNTGRLATYPSYYNCLFTPAFFRRSILSRKVGHTVILTYSYRASICEGGLGSRNSVRMSVCHACTVTKQNDALQIFLYRTKGQSLCYSDTKSGWSATLPSL